MRLKPFAAVILMALILAVPAIAEEDDPCRGIDSIAKQIEKECGINPLSPKCSCNRLSSCREAYDRCVSEMEKARIWAAQVEKSCVEDIESCDCSIIGYEVQRADCERVKGHFADQKAAIINECYDNPEACRCSSIKSEIGRKECERAAGHGAKVKKQCEEDLENCDCESIDEALPREACIAMREAGKRYKAEVQEKCEADPITCDCSMITNPKGRKECTAIRNKAIKKAEDEIKQHLDRCFADIYACDCSSLPDEEYREFCEKQLSLGKTCMQTGEFCDELDDSNLLPSSLPKFLQPFFKSTLQKKINGEKEKGVKLALAVGRKCVNNPEECDCSVIPPYAQAFCLERKELQLSCVRDREIAACEQLSEMVEATPPGTPEFIKKPLDNLLRPLIDKRRDAVKSQYAKEAGETILNCINYPASCDCSDVPVPYNDFCEHKKRLVQACALEHDIDSCCSLEYEDNLPQDIPLFIRTAVKGKVESAVDAKKKEIFEELRPEECSGLSLRKCCDLFYGKFGINETDAGATITIEAEAEDKYKISTPGTNWDSREEYFREGAYGNWYLSRKDDSLYYSISIPSSGNYALWIRDFDDGQHTFGARSITVEVDGKAIGTFSENSQKGWAWHKVADVELKEGKIELVIRKAATTSAAALIDKFILSSEEGFAPQ